MSKTLKVLQICAVPVTARFLLRPLIDRMAAEGCEVHVACSGGRHADALRADGVRLHEMPISRSMLSIGHLCSVWQLYRLMRRERYDVVHVHTPVAAALGRIAARLAKVPIIVYTAHGFYFHDGMRPWVRRPIIWIERWLGQRATDLLFTQSKEDLATAVRERIQSDSRAFWIGNGIAPARFADAPREQRSTWGLTSGDFVVGFVGRLVREKGIVELLDAMAALRRSHKNARLLLVGGEAAGDRDGAVGEALNQLLKERGLKISTVITGFQEDVAPFYRMMDVFVLPSHREGMPRTILEAMASGLPIVASNIRGCREEVLDEETGLLFPPTDAGALATQLERMATDEGLRLRMGKRGREIAIAEFDEHLVLDRQVAALRRFVPGWPGTSDEYAGRGKQPMADMAGRVLKRGLDFFLASLGLLMLGVPFALVGLAIKFDDHGPVFFRQERIGKRERRFRIWKFRTMVLDAASQGLGHTVASDDARITRVGAFLRRWGLDELPQLLNVLTGEMSLVGPRPTLAYQVEHYTPFQRRRLEAKPGITSLAVVSGRNALTWEQRIRLDVRYIDEWTFGLDLVILLRTLWCVLVTKKGLYGEDGVNDPFVSPPTESE